MKSGRFRLVFTAEEGRALLPELPLVGWARINRIRMPGLGAHAHPDLFEIFLIERGEVEWWVEKEVLRVPAPHIYVNRPGELHGSLGPGLKPCGYLWLQLRPDALAEPELASGLASLRRRSFPCRPQTLEAFRALWEAHHAPGAHPRPTARARLHLLLASLLEDHAATAPREVSYAVRQALRLIDARPGEIDSIDELAARVKLGLTRFTERFRAETGFTPAHYLRSRRMELAKQLMLSPRPRTLTEIAHACGYSSGQHFATTFKKLEGCTPTQFLARNRPQN